MQIQHQPSLFSVIEEKPEPSVDDELLEYLRDGVLQAPDDEVLPFVCTDCESIGGYYAASFREIACPHCGGAAHPFSFRGRPTSSASRAVR